MYQKEAVKIKWVDIYTQLGWFDSEEIEQMTPMDCESIGYILKDTQDFVILCSGFAEDGECSDITAIPKGCIKEINKIKGE